MVEHHRGGWGFVIVPIVLVLAFVGYIWFIGETDEERMRQDPDSLTRPRVAFHVEFEGLPVSRSWHYELWEKNQYGGEYQIGGLRVTDGGTIITLAGEPLSEFVLHEYPAPDSEFLLTIEDGMEPSLERSDRVLLSGNMESGIIELAPAITIPEGQEQTAALASPTDAGAPGDAGIWFTLSLPALPNGLVYRSWIVTAGGMALPMGSFSDPSEGGEPSPYDGKGNRRSIPGGDFIANAPDGLKFPLSLSDGRTIAIVSIEPDIYEPIAGQSPFMPIFSKRITFQQRTDTPFSLDAEHADNLPSGRLVLREVDTGK